MSLLDWIVLAATLAGIITYGLYKSNTTKNLEGYFLSNRSFTSSLILLSVMGTQASAVTFLSAPGQAYTDGMRFVQYYLGLPLAMVVLCITFVPIFHHLKVYTAYEYLEKRFDSKTRTFTAVLFLLQRGLSTGISIYAPSIILSSLLGWNIYLTNIFMGGLLIIYTVSGGARAVAYTQQFQFIIIMFGMITAACMVVHLLPPGIGLMDTLRVSGRLGKLNVITSGVKDHGFDWSDRYNIWSGLIGGFFLALSYFGTDQSQVGRYLTARSVAESRLGLLLNGMIKVPMQFFILLVGALIFTFYQFNQAPLSFNQSMVEKIGATAKADSLGRLQKEYTALSEQKSSLVRRFIENQDAGKTDEAISAALKKVNAATEQLRTDFKTMAKGTVAGEVNDTNYIFLRFVVDHLPRGLVGLLIAIIFLAAWGSIAAALNSLASSTVVDIHKKFFQKNGCTEKQDYSMSRWYTLGWGVFSIVVAQFAGNAGSLIELVNILGSLFYGVILGIFLVAFYCKNIHGNATFWSAVLVEVVVLLLFWISKLGFLWLNVIGAMGVVLVSYALHAILFSKQRSAGE